MWMYLFLFLLVWTPLILENMIFKDGDSKKRFVIIAFSILACVVGLRDMIGGYDVYIYGDFFDSLSLKDFSSNTYFMAFLFEKGYALYCYFIHCFTNNRYIFFLITALLSYYLVFKSFRVLDKILLFALFIFFCKYFLMSFVYVRQFLAMGIVWLAVPFIINRNFLKFSIVVLLASTLHTSAVIFFPTYFICKYQYSRNILVWGIVVSILLGLT